MALCGGPRTSKPESLPRNWPRSSQEDIDEKPNRKIKIGSDQQFEFHDNSIKTSKYEIYNFLPKFLLEEFNPYAKIANCYFLLIAALQTIPWISNTSGIPTYLLPLSVVVAINAVFQILEDIKRHRADTEANSSETETFNRASSQFQSTKWSEVVVGDFIRITSRQIIPADIMILSVAEQNKSAPVGLCYVETKSLDGETNLKIRNAMPNTLAKVGTSVALQELAGEIEMEHPNKLINSFSGILDIGQHGREPIQANNLLLRGCVLRNTEWVLGIVVNTGHDTKVMMSNTETKNKVSK